MTDFIKHEKEGRIKKNMGVKWGGGQKSILNCFRYKNALKKTGKNESFSERQYLKKKCFKAWSFPRQLLPPYLIVWGAEMQCQ